MIARKIRQTLKVEYLDQELIQQSLHNCLHHYYDLENIVDIRYGNLLLNPSEIYEAANLNFLFIASDLDINLIIDGNKSFDIMQFVLIQRKIRFRFKIKPQMIPMNCTVNVHYLHGRSQLVD